MAPLTDAEFDARWDSDEVMEAALLHGVKKAAQRHKAASAPMVIWRDGRVVHVPADEVLAQVTASLAAGANGKRGGKRNGRRD